MINPCSPTGLKLPNARPLVAFKPPAGCSVTAPDQPELVTSGAKVFDCKGAEHGFDFAKHRLLAGERILSPATVGIDALDDGKTITLVNRELRPCPTDQRPMPVPHTFLFTVDPDGERTFAEASCTMPRTCK